MDKKTFFILILLISFSINSYTQSQIDSVKMAINQLFIAMKNSDANLLKLCFTDSAIMQTISFDKQGKLIVNNESITVFIETISHLSKDAADERIVFDVIKLDGPLANVWASYDFFYNKQYTHCGVDNFVLVKESSGSWKIQYLIDTRRKDSCKLN